MCDNNVDMTSEADKRRKQRHPIETTSSFRHVLSTPAFYRIGFTVANRVPKGFLYLIADLIGEASFFRYKARGENVRRNLEGVFPGIAEREATSLVRRVFRNYARHLVDYGRFKGMSPESLDRAIREVEGIQNIETALQSQKGQILVTGHLGNWELGALYFARIGRKVNIVTLPDDAPQVDAIRESYRNRYDIHTIVMDGSPFTALEVLSALRRNEMVAMLVDRSREEEGVRVEFFGKPHYFPRGPFTLSRATGAVILPAFIVRDGNGYKGFVEPPFVAEETDDETCARRLARALESMISRFPDQWYNFVPI